MVRKATFRFERDPRENTRTVDDHVEAFEEKNPGCTVAITHEIRGKMACVRVSLVPIMDARSEHQPNFDLGTVEVPVETELTAAQVFREAEDTLRQLKEREVA
ncbi:MAG: hypothetical protein PHO92_00925 [Candidatus Peribacteraceae bacterium]|nr:hypothetical protein [Candidatus Peribacteraceae bacterium]